MTRSRVKRVWLLLQSIAWDHFHSEAFRAGIFFFFVSFTFAVRLHQYCWCSFALSLSPSHSNRSNKIIHILRILYSFQIHDGVIGSCTSAIQLLHLQSMYLAHWLFSRFVFNERFKVISMQCHHPYKHGQAKASARTKLNTLPSRNGRYVDHPPP